MKAPRSDYRVFTEGGNRLVSTRTFNATVAQLMRAHLEPDLLRQWMPGPGMNLEVCEIDARVGGGFRLGWRLPDGAIMWVRGKYLEISATRIVHTELFEPDWTAGESIETTEFIAQGSRTLLRNEVVYKDAEALNAVLALGMGEGMGPCYDRLEAIV